jgi:PAS domain S-box-containing protein
MADGLAGTQPVLLSGAAAARADWRLAMAAALLLLAVFVVTAPFAKQQLAYHWAFIPIYQTALAIIDLMTAGLLFAQFHFTRLRALLVLGCGYLFTACMVVPHTLSYPGLFSEAGLLPGSGPKTTVWLYMFWHGGFPIAVMVYARLKRDDAAALRLPKGSNSSAIFAGVAVVLLAAFALTLVSTAGAAFLPPLVQNNKYTPEMIFVSAPCWMLSLAALVVLWRRRPHSVLDLWLMVVMCAWMFDVALSAVLNNGRFDLGFYAGRVYGLLAAGFVLLMMQVETAKVYARLARLLSNERKQHRREAEQRRRIFDTSLDLILVVDRRGQVLQVSPSAMSILGYEPEEMVGRSAASFVFPEDLDNTRRQMRMARRGGVIRNFECRYVNRSGRPVAIAWMGVWSEPAQEHFFIGRDMTEQKAASDLVKQVSARQEAVFNCALFGILTLNESGSVETLNPAAEVIFGVTAEAVVRRDIGRLVDLGGPKDITSVALLRHMVSGDDGVREVTGLKSDGTTFPMDFFLAEMPVGDRRMFVAFVRDITARKRNERLKGEFVATVSHELRTPMTSIAGSLGLLVGGAAGPLPDSARRLLAIAHSNSQRLVRLINDILDIEKIESGKMVFALQPVEVRALVEQVIESNRGYADGFGVSVRLDPSADHAVVRVDPDRMMQVITNLLSNAVKFSPRGEEVVVGIENKGRSARISMRDRGQGIPDDYKTRVFEKFVQVDATDARQKGGTGLGLSIVKQIILRFGGEVGFDPAPGGGTVFYLELPCWEQMEILETERLERGGRALVLLCEDDRDAAAVLAARPRAAGFPTDVAYTAEEAVKGAATRTYAAILVDLQLPDSDGISLIKQLRAQPRYHNTPIVVVSADPKRGRNDQRSSTLNVLDWLEKPVDTERLVRVLDRPIVRDCFVRPRILHLDDDRDVLRLVAQALASSADVVSVESIDEARHVLSSQEFDLAVLDVALAEVSASISCRTCAAATGSRFRWWCSRRRIRRRSPRASWLCCPSRAPRSTA